MIAWATRLAASLQAEGYAGLLGCDFVEYPDPVTGWPRAFLAEASPRVNGAIYPLVLRDRLNAVQRRSGRLESNAFVSGTIECRPRSFTQFRAAVSHLLYSPATGSGLVPCHVSTLPAGRCGVVVLGASRSDVLRTYGELRTWCRRELA